MIRGGWWGRRDGEGGETVGWVWIVSMMLKEVELKPTLFIVVSLSA